MANFFDTVPRDSRVRVSKYFAIGVWIARRTGFIPDVFITVECILRRVMPILTQECHRTL
ncbi:hypothetical protein WN55_00680 [Dufourea novaeangliae]|uniref:Uncharacterized protein n=1 Tax=Dufourea novaeangliae TaxID=178035 RepID=A0A154NY53_DUFNO|nr:hypothetical protein WN55_00680 [Dufourea novaeangliae]